MNHRNLNEGRALERQCRRNASAIDGSGHDRLLRHRGNAT
jgi:hypothetical protein